MSLKFTAKGSVGELMALFNLLSESEVVNTVETHSLHRNRDMVTGVQTFELSVKPARSFRRTYKPRQTEGYVYLLETSEPGIFKIGRSSDPVNRRKTFNVKLPFMVDYCHVFYSENMYRDERLLKERFERQGKRLNTSEFFRLTESDVEYICSL
jgi:hypothetical protein